MPDFLLELFSEEIPARMQRQAAADLARLFGAALVEVGVPAAATETFATPRRLALIAKGLPQATAAVSEERRGPRADAPEQAVEGFLKSTGLARDQLVERDDPKGRFLYATIAKPGRATADLLGEIVPALIRDFPWPKSMRWGSGTQRWVRPLHGIVALLDGDVVPVGIAGIVACRATKGHRFLSSGSIEIDSAATYADQLRAAHVILSSDEREAIIKAGAEAAAQAAGLTLIEDAGLLAENAGLTEWPVPLLGRFDPAFLDVPPEAIQLTMRANQKYFAVRDPATDKLAPAFVCVANTEASDGGAAIVAGNEKVLAARLSDAKFFWDQDRKTTLESRLPKLADIVFHEKLGTVADKVERVAKLARWLVESGAVRPSPDTRHPDERQDLARQTAHVSRGPDVRQDDGDVLDPDTARLADLAEEAARLCKADLVTAMVGEFPELQGVMGGHYARAEDLDPQVADAIRDHYKPVGQGDDVPTAPVTVAVALADKLDTISAFFVARILPTGSADPFALRRAALGVVRLIVASNARVPLLMALVRSAGLLRGTVVGAKIVGDANRAQLAVRESDLGNLAPSIRQVALGLLGDASSIADKYIEQDTSSVIEAADFIIDRLVGQRSASGARNDLIKSARSVSDEDDLVRLLARVKALQAFVSTEDGTNLLAGYKRAANILRIEEKKDGRAYDGEVSRDLLVLPEEIGLADTLEAVESEARAAVEAEDFAAAMAALARLRPFVDAFFNHVTVNDPDPAKRANRLALLNRIRAAVHSVADFSKIEG